MLHFRNSKLFFSYKCIKRKVNQNTTNKRRLKSSFYSLFYAEAWYDFAGANLRVIGPAGNVFPCEKCSCVGKAESDLTGPRFKPQTSCLKFLSFSSGLQHGERRPTWNTHRRVNRCSTESDSHEPRLQPAPYHCHQLHSTFGRDWRMQHPIRS